MSVSDRGGDSEDYACVAWGLLKLFQAGGDPVWIDIKVLPAHVAADPDLKQRFEREAKTISSLNHPHPAPSMTSASQDGTDFLVMEYQEG